MNNKNVLSIGLVLFCVMIFLSTSCKKKRAEEKVVQTEYANLDDFYNQNQLQEQSFVIDSLGHDSITGSHGTKIWGIPKSIFMYKSNQQDIMYPYVIKLIEAYSIKEMIFAKLPNLSSDKVLQNAGELKVTAFKDNQELALKKNYGYYMLAKNTNPLQGMSVFYGFTNGTANDWNNNVLQTDYLFTSDTVTHILTQNNGYNMHISKLGWVSVNKFNNYSNLTSVTFSSTGTNTNLIDVFIIFKNLHAYLKVSSLSANGLIVGEPITVFAMGKDGSGTMYYFKEDYTISSNLNITLNLQSANSTQVLSVMEGL